MADHDLPEIPPTGSGRGKQIVFLFMTAVVILVVVFLLGVSVGRGVRKTSAPPDGGEAGDTTVAATPPGKTTPTDLNYHDALQPPAGAGAAGQSVRPVAPVAPPSTPPTSPPPPVGDAPPKASPPVEHPAPGAHPEYTLQVGAFKTLTAAQSLLAQVKAKDRSYPASIVTLAESEPGRFRVIVGPFPTADEANLMKSRLNKDKFEAILKR
jgi:cell division protein FtsN